MRNLRKNDGFTLIELMIVVVIIGILAAIAIPKFSQVSNGAKEAEAEPVLKQMCSLAAAVKLQSTDGLYPTTLAGVDGWEDPDGKYYETWEFAGGATGTATAKTTTAGLRNAAMDCDTREITWTAAAATP
jgi:prepilin-type N-terminal cleavage/methylation domain-containing protein